MFRGADESVCANAEHLESGVEFVLHIIEAHLEHIYKEDAPALKKSKSCWWGFFEKYFK